MPTSKGSNVSDISGKVAVVTGGYKGLGLAISRALADAGARVSIWARDLSAMEPVARDLGAQAVACDVSDAADVARAIDATVAELGGVDVMVANAGRRSVFKSFLDVTEEDWAAVVETNLGGVFRTTQAAARQMVAQGGGGKIIVITSIRSGRGGPHAAAYAASKSGAEGLVRVMAVGLAPYGIQVNAVRPGWMATEMTEVLRENGALGDALISQVPAGRWGQPEDLAGVVSYLASGASDFHTGDVITIDGGLMAGDPLDPIQFLEEGSATAARSGG